MIFQAKPQAEIFLLNRHPGFGNNLVEEEKTIEGLVNVLKDQIKFIHVFIIAFKQQVRQWDQCCQMAKCDPFLSLDCTRVEGVGAESKERKGSNFAAQRSGAIVLQAQRNKYIQSKKLAKAIWQPWLMTHCGGFGVCDKALLHCVCMEEDDLGRVVFNQSKFFYNLANTYIRLKQNS